MSEHFFVTQSVLRPFAGEDAGADCVAPRLA
jgi:hypothetical protein